MDGYNQHWVPYGFPAPMWKQLMHPGSLDAISRTRLLTLALPCIGIDACGHALRRLGVPFKVRYAHDVLTCLAGPLTALHGSIEHFNFGRMDGDLLRADITAWDRVDGVVTGPPCPPWSAIGQRSSWNDPRAQVFSKVNDIIIDQGHKGAYFFILEMVDGMNTHRKTRHGNCDNLRHLPEMTPYNTRLSDLSRRAPMWEVHVWMMDTQNYLPQHRRRLYTIGVNKSVGCTTPCTPPLPMPFQQITLADLMHPGIPQMQEHCLPIHLLQHLTVAESKFLAGIQSGQIMATQEGGWWMAVELDRSP